MNTTHIAPGTTSHSAHSLRLRIALAWAAACTATTTIFAGAVLGLVASRATGSLRLFAQTVTPEAVVISLFALGLSFAVSALLAYWLNGWVFYPIREISCSVPEIHAASLHRRVIGGDRKDEVGELARAFNQMLEQLERAFEQQSRFVGDAAHELRTPLATLRANLEVVLADPNASLADYKAMGTVLERSLNRLERLVSGLLLLARGEPDIVREPVALWSLLEDVILFHKPLAEEKKVSLQLTGHGTVNVSGDGPLLARIFGDLIENGIRYNRPGGKVLLDVEPDTTWVSVSVRDTGIGISPEERRHLFQRFYRSERSRSRHSGGEGLGLSIVDHLVRLHGGTVEVKSSPDVGSTFTVRLPIASVSDPDTDS